jgi:dolichol kinase
LERVRSLSGRLHVLGEEQRRAGKTRVADAMTSAAEDLAGWASAMERGGSPGLAREHHARLAQDYAALARALEGQTQEAQFRRLTPTNYVRNLFHAASGLSAALIYHLFLDRAGALAVMGTIAGTFSALEILRRSWAPINERLMHFGFFARIARPHEHQRVNSSTWFAWGLLTSVLIGSPLAVQAACLVCAFGDPAATLVGKRFGRTLLIRDRTLAGTVTFVAVSAIALGTFLIAAASTPPLLALGLALAAGFAGAMAELFSRRIDDNFAVPVVVTAVLTLIA